MIPLGSGVYGLFCLERGILQTYAFALPGMFRQADSRVRI